MLNDAPTLDGAYTLPDVLNFHGKCKFFALSIDEAITYITYSMYKIFIFCTGFDVFVI